MFRARCEPGLARWVPRRLRRSAPRDERRLPLHWCWFYIEDPAHVQARARLTLASGLACKDPTDPLDAVDAQLLGQLRGQLELPAGRDGPTRDHLRQDLRAV